jgi:hypothetical protein
VRLSVQHAATLWRLVKHETMAHTTVVLRGEIPGAAEPDPLTAEDPGYGAPQLYPRNTP